MKPSQKMKRAGREGGLVDTWHEEPLESLMGVVTANSKGYWVRALKSPSLLEREPRD